MRSLVIAILFSNICNSVFGQFSHDYLRYTDFHIHPTYKHYFRYPNSDEMKMMYKKSRYDKDKDTIIFLDEVNTRFKDTNWIKVVMDIDALKAGETSDLANYDQSGYPEIKFVPGSILCNSYSPYEKQFAFSGLNRYFSRKVVTKMGKFRLKSYSLDDHSPFRDFLAEYYYNCMQEEYREIKNYYPKSIYGSAGEVDSFYFINRIKMVECADELKDIVKKNDLAFEELKKQPGNKTTLPVITTPLLMSIEGGQVLYDSLTAMQNNIFNPLYLSKPTKRKDRKKVYAPPEVVRAHLLKNADSLRNLRHRLFFITLGHFAQNHVVGFAKTLDRDPGSWVHRAISTLTSIMFIKKSILKKDYHGLNLACRDKDEGCVPDSIGFKIIEAFLNPTKGRCGKPTYIDVKHMDIRGRLQYYAMRRVYAKQFNTRIPIIASHFAVSGEGQALAAATGLGKDADDYGEIINPDGYYRRLKKNDSKQKKIIAYLEKPGTSPIQQQQSNFNKSMLRQLQFVSDTAVTAPASEVANVLSSDPFDDIIIDSSKVGWYYPWSINLFDEEIIEINKSDGIIGILMDPRQLGAFMPKYNKIDKRMKQEFDSTLAAIPPDSLSKYGFKTKEDVNMYEYFKTEPLIRNIFYIVQVIKIQDQAEEFYKANGNNLALTRSQFRAFVPDEMETEKDPWNMIAIGGDFDGLIDPIDIAPTASYIPHLRSRMILFAYIFSQMRKNEFWDTAQNRPFITSLYDSYDKMKKFFYENGKSFILEYF